MTIRALLVALTIAVSLITASAMAQQQGPLKLTLRDGVIEPVSLALPDFVPESAESAEMARNLVRVISADLVGTSFFREIPASAFISPISDFSAPVKYEDWKAINAQGLLTGAVNVQGDQVTVKFRVHDVFSGQELGQGLQFAGTVPGWRRMAHKIADAIYSRITGESGYFDSRIVFVSESGPKDQRRKRLAVMDYDGSNVQYLTDSRSIVLAPRFSPTGDRVLYTSYETGFPQIYVLDVGSVQRRVLQAQDLSLIHI